MRTLVIGDIHGAYKALVQCLERSGFDNEQDRLIALGDVCDGWPEVDRCVNELLKIKHCDYVIGNHDLMALDWAIEGSRDEDWLSQGGGNTIASYHGGTMPQRHIDFFKKASLYLQEKDILFVHAGFDVRKPLAEQSPENLVWDRDLVYRARDEHWIEPDFKFPYFREIFIGHTPTGQFHSDHPLKYGNVFLLDTGAGWGGKLTVMDAATKQYWQSDPTAELYPNDTPRLR